MDKPLSVRIVAAEGILSIAAPGLIADNSVVDLTGTGSSTKLHPI